MYARCESPLLDPDVRSLRIAITRPRCTLAANRHEGRTINKDLYTSAEGLAPPAPPGGLCPPAARPPTLVSPAPPRYVLCVRHLIERGPPGSLARRARFIGGKRARQLASAAFVCRARPKSYRYTKLKSSGQPQAGLTPARRGLTEAALRRRQNPPRPAAASRGLDTLLLRGQSPKNPLGVNGASVEC